MLIGVPKEIKADEYRVGLIPPTIKELVARGHDVMVETLAGNGAGIGDAEYAEAGARIVTDADAIFQRAELIVKSRSHLRPSAANCDAARSFSLICTWRPIPSRRMI